MMTLVEATELQCWMHGSAVGDEGGADDRAVVADEVDMHNESAVGDEDVADDSTAITDDDSVEEGSLIGMLDGSAIG